MNGLKIIVLFILLFISCCSVFIFIHLAFPEIGTWKSISLVLSYLAFYWYLKIKNMIDDEF